MDQAIRLVADAHPRVVTLFEEDPETFGVGHYVIENSVRDARLVINEQYVGTDSSDDERTPNSWLIEDERPHLVDGSPQWKVASSKEYPMDNVEQLVKYVSAWTRDRVSEQATRDAMFGTQNHAQGISQPPSQTLSPGL